MSKYNTYARKLDTAFKAARDEYAAAFQKLQQAQQEELAARAWRPDDTAEEKAIRVARAALVLHDAEATFNEASSRVWSGFQDTRRTLREELKKEASAAGVANPDAIDSNALELMKTGVLTSADYSAFLEKYDGNCTMLKLIAHYAHEAAEATESRKEAAALNAIALSCQSGQNAIMRAWDELSAAADRFGRAKDNPELFVTMSARWEESTGAAVENF